MHLLPTTAVILLIDTQREFQVGYKGRKSGKRNLKGILRHPNRRNNQFIFWLSLTFGWQQIVVDIWRCGTREQKAPSFMLPPQSPNTTCGNKAVEKSPE